MVFGLALLAFALSGWLAKALGIGRTGTNTIKLYRVNCELLDIQVRAGDEC